MPIPETKDVGKTISFLKTEKPGMPKKQKIAIALDVARRSGAKIVGGLLRQKRMKKL